MELEKIFTKAATVILFVVLCIGIILPEYSNWCAVIIVFFVAFLLEKRCLKQQGIEKIITNILLMISMSSLIIMTLWLIKIPITAQNTLFASIIVFTILLLTKRR